MREQDIQGFEPIDVRKISMPERIEDAIKRLDDRALAVPAMDDLEGAVGVIAAELYGIRHELEKLNAILTISHEDRLWEAREWEGRR